MVVCTSIRPKPHIQQKNVDAFGNSDSITKTSTRFGSADGGNVGAPYGDVRGRQSVRDGGQRPRHLPARVGRRGRGHKLGGLEVQQTLRHCPGERRVFHICLLASADCLAIGILTVCSSLFMEC